MLPIGTTVKATFRGEWKGIILAENDIRAWEGTIAFYGTTPDQAAVDKQVEYINTEIKQKYPNERATVPVLWEFGKTYWEHTDTLFIA